MDLVETNGKLTPQRIDAAIKQVAKRHYGFGGNCAEFAIVLNSVLGGIGTLVAADSEDHYEYVDHIALKIGNRYFDGSGLITARELREYGKTVFDISEEDAVKMVDNDGSSPFLNTQRLEADLRKALTLTESVVEEARRAPVSTLYHLTRLEKLPSIRSNGLQPSYSQSPTHLPRAVYMGSDVSQIGSYAAKWHKDNPAEGYAILGIQVGGLDPVNLYPCDNELADVLAQRGNRREWTNVNWRESLQLCGQCSYRGWIKTPEIRVIACMIPGQGWQKIDIPLEYWNGPAAPAPRTI